VSFRFVGFYLFINIYFRTNVMHKSGSETKVEKKPQPTTATTVKKGAKRKNASQLTDVPAGSGKSTTDEKPSGPKNRRSGPSQEPASATSGPGAVCPAPRDPEPEPETQTQRLFLDEAFAHLIRNDPSMGPLIDRHGPPACFTGPTGSDPFHALCRTIVYQQLALKAAATIFGRLTDLYMRTIQTTERDTNIDTDGTPKPLLSLTVEELQSVGLSNQKASYIQNVARYFEDGSGGNA
jgi:DNA-3-methyladenine glycosylase II